MLKECKFYHLIYPPPSFTDKRHYVNWIRHLTERRRDARIYGVPIRDTYYNMLRLI